MEVYIGEIVNTHGLKGELRIVSDFAFKKNVFIPGMKIYLGKRKQEMTIQSYRPHKIYDMILLEGVNDINEAIAFKGDSVYVRREDIDIDGYVKEEILGLDVYNNNEKIGVVKNIIHNPSQDVLVIQSNHKQNMVPNVPEFVKNIDLENKRIDIEVIEGLLQWK